MSKTVATIPLQENDAQYYAGQQLISTTGGGGTNFSFPNLNTTLISNYNEFGDQVRSTGNFSIHLLPTSTTLPSTGNLINPALVSVSNDTNNTVLFQSNQPADQFLFLQLTDVAIGENYGSYSVLSLNDIINNFIVAYTGQDKILTRVKRTDVLFHARRAIQEFSYDTIPSTKSMETTVPTTLNVPLPQDYVNYIRLSWADVDGVLRTIYPLSGLSGNPTEIPVVDANGVPTQDAFDSNLESSGSIIEQRWDTANQNTLSGNYDPYNNNGVYDHVWWKQAYGQRYGLEPELAQSNGYFSVNERLGTFSFSGNVANKIIMISYISDGLSYNLDSIVPKMLEDAMYSKIMSNIITPRNDVDAGTKAFYKRDAYVKTRNAKIRLSNLKLGEIVQIFRGQAKWIKR
jgi:hypothetical protein